MKSTTSERQNRGKPEFRAALLVFVTQSGSVLTDIGSEKRIGGGKGRRIFWQVLKWPGRESK